MPKALFASKRNLVHGLLQEDIPHAVFARQADISERQMHHIKHNLVNMRLPSNIRSLSKEGHLKLLMEWQRYTLIMKLSLM